jgi:hypothetical protein
MPDETKPAPNAVERLCEAAERASLPVGGHHPDCTSCERLRGELAAALSAVREQRPWCSGAEIEQRVERAVSNGVDSLKARLAQVTEERDVARRDAQVLLQTYDAFGGDWETTKNGVDVLKARLAEMEKALRTFGRHNWDCKFLRYPIYDACSCGWDEIRILINKS